MREAAVHDTHFTRLWFMDIAGMLKSLATDLGELENVFIEGTGFDGSSIEGLTCVHESDMLLVPDVQTFQLLPWRNVEKPVARMLCDAHAPDGQKAYSDSHAVLQRAVERARALGFTVMVYPEIEFYLPRQPVPVDHTAPIGNVSYFDHIARGDSNDSRWQAVRVLEDMDIAVEFLHHEGGPG